MKKSFIPMELPLVFKNNDQFEDILFHTELLKYTEAITKFKTVSKKTKLNPDLIYSSLLFNEAIFSTKIEGTQATITDVYEYEISKPQGKNQDIEEVFSYFDTVKAAEKQVNQFAISNRLFRSLHRILMAGNVRGKNLSPGEYRQTQNYIGPKGCTINNAAFIPPSPEKIDDAMSNLEKYINYDQTNHPIIRTAIFHAQFETIHPFLDGNGRLGRVLIPVVLFYFNQIDTPNFFVSESLEKNRFKYYNLLNGTRENTKQGWQEWISFFISSVTEQTIKDTDKIEKIDSLYESTLKKARKIKDTSTMVDLIPLLFESPIFTALSISKKLKINPNTARNYLAMLSDGKIISHNDVSRNKKFYFYDLISIL